MARMQFACFGKCSNCGLPEQAELPFPESLQIVLDVVTPDVSAAEFVVPA